MSVVRTSGEDRDASGRRARHGTLSTVTLASSRRVVKARPRIAGASRRFSCCRLGSARLGSSRPGGRRSGPASDSAEGRPFDRRRSRARRAAPDGAQRATGAGRGGAGADLEDGPTRPLPRGWSCPPPSAGPADGSRRPGPGPANGPDSWKRRRCRNRSRKRSLGRSLAPRDPPPTSSLVSLRSPLYVKRPANCSSPGHRTDLGSRCPTSGRPQPQQGGDKLLTSRGPHAEPPSEPSITFRAFTECLVPPYQ